MTNVTITGDVQGQPFKQSVKIDLPAKDDNNPEIERMWAWKRVDQLLAAARESGSVDSVRDEVVKLCEEFSITSEYASFIVLENDAEYQRWKIERRNVSRLGRDRVAQERVAQQLEVLREQALAKLGPSTEASRERTATPLPNVSQPVEKLTNSRSLPTTTPGLPQTVNRRPPPAFDLNLPTGGGGGGGAIDPISAAIGLGLAGASAVAAKRRKRSAEKCQS
jgi:Ca-activated chloride channel family protein